MGMQTRIDGYWVKSGPITAAHAAATSPVLWIPAGTYVDKVVLVIAVAFGGGGESIDIGDGDNADGWIDTGDVSETVIGAYVGDETTTTAYCLGKYYAAADTIDAVVSAGITLGTAYVLAYCIDMDEA